MRMESFVAPTSTPYFETTSMNDYKPPGSDKSLERFLRSGSFILLYTTCTLYVYVTIVLLVYKKDTFNSSFFHICIANAFADLFCAVLVNKFTVICSAATIKWNFIVNFIATIFTYSSMLGIMLLGFNRITSLMTTSHNSIWSPGRTAKAITCQWIISVFISLPFVVPGRLLYVAENGMMASDNKKLHLGLILYSDISYAIFCAIICFVYIAAIIGTYSRSKKLMKIVSEQSSHALRMARRTNIMLLSVGCALCIFLCISVAARFSIRYFSLLSQHRAMWIFTICLWYLSMYGYMLANPWLLLLLSSDVRMKCKQLPHECAGKLFQTFDYVFYFCCRNSSSSEMNNSYASLEKNVNHVFSKSQCICKERSLYPNHCKCNSKQEEFV